MGVAGDAVEECPGEALALEDRLVSVDYHRIGGVLVETYWIVTAPQRSHSEVNPPSVAVRQVTLTNCLIFRRHLTMPRPS